MEQKRVHVKTSGSTTLQSVETPLAAGHPLSVIDEDFRAFPGDELTSDGRLLAAILVAFALVTILAGFDVASDLGHGTTLEHALAEVGIVALGLLGSALMARQLLLRLRRARAAEVALQALAGRLEATEKEAARWRAEAADVLSGLGNAIDQQFERWALSPAEKEVAMLLLKGLSHKELAGVRSVTEATARQQARAVYKKAGLSGRNDLAAFFLEDLLLPSEKTASGSPT
jgi:DNA-binding CsgD family transcriptional regulator